MPYVVAGTLTLPESSKPATNVTITFRNLMTVSPLIVASESSVTTSAIGAYSISLQYSVYAVEVTYYNNRPISAGQIVLNSETQTGLDLPTLLNGGEYEPATPAWILQIEAWLVEAQNSANASANSAQTSQSHANASAASAAAASASAAQASRISGLSTVAEAIGMAALPLPDVWAPLSDSLRMITGYGREVKVGEDVVARMVNFSRNSTATYIGKDGLLKTAAANEPRFEKEGLRIEGPSTNLVIRSADMTQSPWIGYNSGTGVLPIVTGNYAVAPDGSQSATRLILNKGTGRTGADTATMICPLNTTVGSTYTISVWLKSTDGVSQPKVSLSFNGESGATITVTGEWRRYQITTPSATDASRFPRLQLREGLGTSDTADLLVWGWQQEALPFASSYIPTNGAAVTRAGDIVTIPWAMNIHPSAVTVAVNYDLLGLGAFNQRIIEYSESVNPRYVVQMTQIGVLQSYAAATPLSISGAPYSPGSTFAAASTPSRHAVKVSGRNIMSYAAEGAAKYRPSIPIGSGSVGQDPMFGHLRNLRIWHRTLTDDQLKAVA